MKNPVRFNWKIFSILLAACVFGIIAVLPYTVELQKAVLDKVPMPLWLLMIIQVLQSVVLFAIAIAVGLFLAGKVGLGLPVLEARLAGESVRQRILAWLPLSIIIGVIGSALIVGLDVYVFGPAIRAEFGSQGNLLNLQGPQPAAWKGLLASFYGGIDEEVLLRLCLMSLFVWLGKFISRDSSGQPTAPVYWIANIIAAVLFGLGHLPAVSTILPLTGIVIARTVVLNGLLGIAFGYLYWKHGLESAIVSHFSADIVLHVLMAL